MMYHRIKYSVLLCFITGLLTNTGLYAQVEGEKDAEVSALSDEQVKAIIRSDEMPGMNGKQADINALQHFFTPPPNSYARLQGEVYQARARRERSDIGLGLRTYGAHNLRDGVEDQAELFARSRLRTGVEWSLLGQGLKSNRMRASILDKQQLLEELNAQASDKEENYGQLYNAIHYLHDQSMMALLDQRLDILESQSELMYDFYYSHDLPYSEVLQVKERLAESRGQRQTYREYVEAYQKLVNAEWLVEVSRIKRLPAVDISLETLLQKAAILNDEERRMALESDIIRMQAKLRNQPTFKINAMYSYNERDRDPRQVNFGSFGFSLGIPITFGGSKKVQRVRMEYERERIRNEDFHLAKELMNHFYEYRYKLKQYTNLAYALQQAQERFRVELTVGKEVLDEEELRLKKLQQADEVLAIKLEMQDVLKQLHLKLLKIYTIHPAEDMRNYIEPFYLEDSNKPEIFVQLDLSKVNNANLSYIVGYLQKGRWYNLVVNNGALKNPKTIAALQAEGFALYHLNGYMEIVQKQAFLDQHILAFNTEEAVEVLVADYINRQQLDQHLQTLSGNKVILNNLEQLLQMDENELIFYQR